MRGRLMAEFEIHPKDKDAALAVWLIGMSIMALFTISTAFSENIESVIRDIGIHVGTVLIVMLLGTIAWFIGRSRIEKTGLWKYK